MKPILIKIAAWVSLLFGLVTIVAGGSVILDLFGMREKEGNYVFLVVWANFICGFLYVIAAWGFFQKKSWTRNIMSIAVWILIVAIGAMLIRVWNNGVYETKTVYALAFRSIVTLVLLWIARTIRT